MMIHHSQNYLLLLFRMLADLKSYYNYQNPNTNNNNKKQQKQQMNEKNCHQQRNQKDLNIVIVNDEFPFTIQRWN